MDVLGGLGEANRFQNGSWIGLILGAHDGAGQQGGGEEGLYLEMLAHKVANLSQPALDEKLLLLINREWTSPALDWFMATMSSFPAWLPLFVIAGLFVAVRGSFRTRAFLVVMLLAVALSDGVVAHSMKRIVNRPRPHQARDEVRVVDLAPATPRLLAIGKAATVKFSRMSLEEVEGRSYPSGHTMNSTAVAVVALAFFGWRAWWVVLVAAAVSYSRIYVGAHWPSDVVVSVFLSVGVTLLFLAAIEWLWRTWGGRLLPKTYAQHPKLVAA